MPTPTARARALSDADRPVDPYDVLIESNPPGVTLSPARIATERRRIIASARDADLLAAYHACDAEPGDPWLDALTAEIERRNLDI